MAAVINAVHCARRLQQSLEQWKCQVLFTNASINQREIAIHDHAVDRNLTFRLQLSEAILSDRVLFAPHERIEPAEVSMSNSTQGRLFDGVFKNGLASSKYFCALAISPCARAMEPSKKLRGVDPSPVYENSLAVDASITLLAAA